MIAKVYVGWILMINGREWTVIGQNKVRSTTWYFLSCDEDGRHISREDLLSRMNSGDISYVRSVPVPKVSHTSLHSALNY